MSDLKTFSELVTWATWHVAEGMAKGVPLSQLLHAVLSYARRWEAPAGVAERIDGDCVIAWVSQPKRAPEQTQKTCGPLPELPTFPGNEVATAYADGWNDCKLAAERLYKVAPETHIITPEEAAKLIQAKL